jgi:hypothetical protein
VGDHRWQELTEDECRRLLGEHHLGRLALVDAADERDRTGRSVVVRIRPASVTGRRVALPADLPFTLWG